MNGYGKMVLLTVALMFATLPAADASEPEDSASDAKVLCEIYSRYPTTQEITIDSSTRPRAMPVVVHHCQELILSAVGGDATVSITDATIAAANRERLDPRLDGVIGNTVVLQIPANRKTPASIIVPEDYPNEDRAVIVRYFVECFDPSTEDSYPCEGGSPPIFIIPKRR